jgi:hypothetical protein
LHATRPHHHAGLEQRQLGRLEEVDLADLGIERIEVERLDRGPLLGERNGQLQLDAVRVARE